MGAARGLQHHPRLWRARARHEPGRRNGAADARGVPERDRSQGQMATRATVERAADVLFCGLLGDLRLSPAFEGRARTALRPEEIPREIPQLRQRPGFSDRIPDEAGRCRPETHTSETPSPMRLKYALFRLKQ